MVELKEQLSLELEEKKKLLLLRRQQQQQQVTADITDITDAADITDITDAADITDITDAADITDITDVTDAADITDISDITHSHTGTDSPQRKICRFKGFVFLVCRPNTLMVRHVTLNQPMAD